MFRAISRHKTLLAICFIVLLAMLVMFATRPDLFLSIFGGVIKYAANMGNARAQYRLGTMYRTGDGVSPDYDEALNWYRKAADQGDIKAQTALREQKLVKAHLEKIYELAEQGDTEDLGLMYYYGFGMARDYVEAYKWLAKAALQGKTKAQYHLGLMYYSGKGVAQDYTEAIKWYRLAAEQGYASAQHNLGAMYFNGEGVVKDYTEAAKWFGKAAQQGHQGAKEALGTLKNRTSPTP